MPDFQMMVGLLKGALSSLNKDETLQKDSYPDFTDKIDEDDETRPRNREWNKPEAVQIREHKTVSRDIFSRMAKMLGFLDEADMPTEPYVAYAVTNVNATYDNAHKINLGNFAYNDGWDGSYHDAEWLGHGLLCAWGKTEQEAESVLSKAIGHLVPAEDPVKQRFEMRRLVRPGD